MLTRKIGEGGRWLLEKIVDAVASTGINPNLLTFFGLLVNGWAAVLFAMGKFRSGALVIFFAAFLDMLDGQVARREKRVTAFGECMNGWTNAPNDNFASQLKCALFDAGYGCPLEG